MTAPSNQLSAFSYQLSAIGDEPSCRLVVVAGGAVADVELIADNRKEHWVRAVQQQAVERHQSEVADVAMLHRQLLQQSREKTP